jgi:hypothetical protein
MFARLRGISGWCPTRVPEQIVLAGGEPAVGVAGARSREMSWETFVGSDPEVIVLGAASTWRGPSMNGRPSKSLGARPDSRLARWSDLGYRRVGLHLAAGASPGGRRRDLGRDPRGAFGSPCGPPTASRVTAPESGLGPEVCGQAFDENLTALLRIRKSGGAAAVQGGMRLHPPLDSVA